MTRWISGVDDWTTVVNPMQSKWWWWWLRSTTKRNCRRLSQDASTAQAINWPQLAQTGEVRSCSDSGICEPSVSRRRATRGFTATHSLRAPRASRENCRSKPTSEPTTRRFSEHFSLEVGPPARGEILRVRPDCSCLPHSCEKHGARCLQLLRDFQTAEGIWSLAELWHGRTS